MLSPAGMHVRICPQASARAGDEPTEARSIHFVLSEDHDVGGMIMITDLAQTLVITIVTFAILELQPLFKWPNGPNRQYLACANPVMNAIGRKTTPASIT